MDPRDDLDSLAGGVGCAACGDLVPTDRVRVLARGGLEALIGRFDRPASGPAR